jgi:antitoxin MazE
MRRKSAPFTLKVCAKPGYRKSELPIGLGLCDIAFRKLRARHSNVYVIIQLYSRGFDAGGAAQIGEFVWGHYSEIIASRSGDPVEMTLEAGRIVLVPIKRRARAGWADASRSLADARDDSLVWPEFANAEDEALIW